MYKFLYTPFLTFVVGTVPVLSDVCLFIFLEAMVYARFLLTSSFALTNGGSNGVLLASSSTLTNGSGYVLLALSFTLINVSNFVIYCFFVTEL